MTKSLASRFVMVFFFLFAVSLCSPMSINAADKKEILIGTNVPVTGVMSFGGKEMYWTFQEIVKDYNANGGIFVKEYNKKLPIRLILEDGESDPGKTAAAVDRLVKMHKVDLLLSSWGTPIVLPACVAAEKLKVYYHCTDCIIDPWASQNFKWSTMYFFDSHQSASVPFKVLDSIPAGKKPKKYALLLEESADGKAMGPMWQFEAKKANYSFDIIETFPVGSKDFSSLILKLKSKGIDGAIMFSGDEAITFVRQMKEAELNLKYYHVYKGALASAFWDALGKDAQYVVADGWWDEKFPYPKCEELGKRYTAEFGQISKIIGLYWATAQTLFEAIEVAGTLDSAKVREAVIRTKFKTPMGDVDYDENGIATFTQGAFQWWAGEPRMVYPFNLSHGYKIKVPPPWDQR